MGEWSVKSGELNANFASCAMPRLEDRMEAMAGNNQFLFFAERHDDIATLNVLSQPETIAALSQGGHRAIATEIFSIGYNKLFEGYYEGSISEEAMRFAVVNMPTNIEADMGVEDEGVFLERYANIVSEAKAQNMRFYGLSAGEGFYDTTDLSTITQENDKFGDVLKDAMGVFDKTEGFSALPRDQQLEAMYAGLSQKGWRSEDIASATRGLGLVEIENQSYLDGLTDEQQTQLFINRLDQDHIIADRLQAISTEVGGGVSTVYGGFHVWRAGVSADRGYGPAEIGNDIDRSLGEDRTAVVSIFTDSKEFWQEFIPDVSGELYGLGISLENGGDYQIDMKNSRWYDGRTDTNCDVEMPPGIEGAATLPGPEGPPRIENAINPVEKPPVSGASPAP